MVTDYGPSSDLHTVFPSIDQDFANFSRQNFWEFLIPSTVVQNGPQMPPFVALADFSEKTNCLFWPRDVTQTFLNKV